LADHIVTSINAAAKSKPLDAQRIAELIAALPELNEDLIEQLLSAQQNDGRWLGTPWFFDFAGDFCSDAYATAVAIEGLSRQDS
jgi:hypothetical protein